MPQKYLRLSQMLLEAQILLGFRDNPSSKVLDLSTWTNYANLFQFRIILFIASILFLYICTYMLTIFIFHNPETTSGRRDNVNNYLKSFYLIIIIHNDVLMEDQQ